MTTLDFSSSDYSPEELRTRVQAALIESETETGETPTAVKISEATYLRIHEESPGMKMLVNLDLDNQTFFGLRLIRG